MWCKGTNTRNGGSRPGLHSYCTLNNQMTWGQDCRGDHESTQTEALGNEVISKCDCLLRGPVISFQPEQRH